MPQIVMATWLFMSLFLALININSRDIFSKSISLIEKQTKYMFVYLKVSILKLDNSVLLKALRDFLNFAMPSASIRYHLIKRPLLVLPPWYKIFLIPVNSFIHRLINWHI